jgi:hypothetical protein
MTQPQIDYFQTWEPLIIYQHGYLNYPKNINVSY